MSTGENTPLLKRSGSRAIITAAGPPVQHSETTTLNQAEQGVIPSPQHSAAIVAHHLAEQKADDSLPDNDAKTKLAPLLATSRVRLHNWRLRLHEIRARHDRQARWQLSVSLIATFLASLAAILGVLNAADNKDTPVLAAIALGVTVANALAAAMSSTVNQIIATSHKSDDDREPENSRSSVSALKAWRAEASAYVRRYQSKLWGSTLECVSGARICFDAHSDDVESLSSRLPPDVVLPEE